MKKNWFSVFAGLVLLLTSTLPAAVPQTVSYTCVPGTPGVQTYGPVTITVGTNKHLVGKFFYPVFTTPSSPPVNFDAGTLPGVMMTHGFGQTYMNVEAMAQNLAKNCMVVLVFNYFGQGWDWEVSTGFSRAPGA